LNAQKTYQELLNLDQDEKHAYQYYLRTGKELSFFQAYAVGIDNPAWEGEPDFSRLETPEAQKHFEELDAVFAEEANSEQSSDITLAEKLFILKDYNVEIQRAQRYIRMFPHRHDFFEIECTLRDSGLHYIGGECIEMHAGDICIVPPGARHNTYLYPDGIMLNIKIRKSTFENVFTNILQDRTALSEYFVKTLYTDGYCNSLTFHCGDDSFITDLLLYLYEEQFSGKPYSNKVIDGLIMTFFAYLIQNYDDTIEFSSASNNSIERIIEIENYIRQNYKDATLKSTAEHFYLSPQYLSTIIKKQTGKSFTEIIRTIKMQHARDMLMNTKMKIDDICEAVGYHDTTQFIRTFKKQFGSTPKQYQKQNMA